MYEKHQLNKYLSNYICMHIIFDAQTELFMVTPTPSIVLRCGSLKNKRWEGSTLSIKEPCGPLVGQPLIFMLFYFFLQICFSTTKNKTNTGYTHAGTSIKYK